MDPRLAGRLPRQAPNPLDDQQMQSAKITLLTSLLKPDPKATKLTPAIINDFHPLLVSIAADNLPNSPEFVKCVARIVIYIAPSRKRIFALGEHLVKLVTSFRQSHGNHMLASVAALNFLHLLGASFACILKTSSDMNLHSDANPALFFATKVSHHAVQLIELAAPRAGLEAAHVHKQIHSLLFKWKETHTFTSSIRINMRNAARSSYDAWLTWLKNNHPDCYEKTKHLSTGSHSHLVSSQDISDDSWYNAPVSSMIPHIKGQKPIRVAAIESQNTSCLPPSDPEMDLVVAQHIAQVAKIFAGPNVARFAPEDNITLNGLGQPVSTDPITGKRKRKYSAYYGMMEKCAKSLKKAREELPDLVQVPEPDSGATYSSRHVPPPMEMEQDYAPYQNMGQSRGGQPQSFSGARGGGWGGGGSSFGGDRGRGFGGRGGSRGGHDRPRGGRGGWN